MKTKISFASFLLIFVIFACSHNKQISDNQKINVEVNCIAFYNLENLFDTIHDDGKNDFEYLPAGANKWNTIKYKSKLHNMAFAISQIGADDKDAKLPMGAVILGVSEVENRRVLEDLVAQPEIANRQYQIVHHEGPDRRGVDVALLYNPRYFTVTSSKSHFLGKKYLTGSSYENSPDSTFRTRDQLLVSGYLQGEKIHVIVNHWPSRTGGEKQSEPLRIAAARLTRHIVDSLMNVDINSKIVVMGDLNDDPFNESCAKILGAKKDKNAVEKNELYNVFWKTLDSGVGSLIYNGRPNLFDQIIVSSGLINGAKTELQFWKAEVFRRNFLLQQEGQYKGTPLRTHAGGVWLNGYSDHLPTLIYLIKEK
ncbi:MAG: endonuclease/exonuclease/phosphatase family protein [Paludibacter sp.]|jgi:predicted extracellular nuclease|nr:endonuclease/exonuclease/phosphatase family protein [Paludibacter sp.]